MSDMKMTVIDRRWIGLNHAETLVRGTDGPLLVAVTNSSPKRGAGAATCR